MNHPQPNRGSRRLIVGATLVALVAGAAWIVLAPRDRERPTVASADGSRTEVEAPFAAGPSGPESAARNAEPARVERAPVDPLDTMTAALADPDPRRRAERLQAALAEWAAVAPEAAAGWALSQTVLHHDLALSSVFRGAAADPAAAIRLTESLARALPERAADHGGYLLAALGEAGAHAEAAEFATSAEESRSIQWLTAAYARWGRDEPLRALATAGTIENEERQYVALQAVVSSWARTEPAELAATVADMPPGFHRRVALLTALRAWHERDPAAARDFVTRTPDAPSLEQVVEN